MPGLLKALPVPALSTLRVDGNKQGPPTKSLLLLPLKVELQPAQRKGQVHIPTEQTFENLLKAVKTCISWF